MNNPGTDLKDILKGLASSPWNTVDSTFHLVLSHALTNWWRILLATALFIAVLTAMRRARRTIRSTDVVTRTASRRNERRQAIVSMTVSILEPAWWAFYIAMMLGMVGITISDNTAGLFVTVAAFAVALAGQTVVKDIIAGMTIIGEDQYGVGDYIDTGFGFAGVVTRITPRTTRMRAEDGTIYHVRNSDISKVGNLTASTGSLLLDVTLTPFDEHFVTAEEVDDYSARIVTATADLREVLEDAAELVAAPMTKVADVAEETPLASVAAVAPVVNPRVTADTLTDLRAISDNDDVEAAHLVRRTLAKAPEGTTPVIRIIEMLGLVGSTGSAVTLRIRVRLTHRAAHTAASMLVRRAIFDAFAPDEVAASFETVPDGEVLTR